MIVESKKPEEKKKTEDEEFMDTLKKALKRAIGGGISGASAMAIQVLTLMWLRTVMNYQYAKGTSMLESLKILYKEGGVARLYQGLLMGLFQGPLSRFGDTAANAGVLALLKTSTLPIGVKTFASSTAAGLWRIFIMPIDTVKTVL